MNPDPKATDELSEFNRIAIELSPRFTAAREALKTPGGPRTPDELFPDYNRAGFGLYTEWRRMGEQHVSDYLARKARALGVQFEHVGITLGSVLHNIDLKQALSEEQVAFIRQALLERKALFFRDQHLDEEQQLRFARCFGDLDAFPFGKPGHNPFIFELNHGDQDPGNQNGWHTDVTWMERPSLGSVAQLVKAPPVGGDTLFSDSYAAYEGLRKEVRDELPYLAGISDYRSFLSHDRKPLPEEFIAEIKQKVPFGVSHPLARTHPETGKTALFLHMAFIRYDSVYDARNGKPLGENASRKLVKELVAQHARPEYGCRFQWQEGSVAFWDNRAVQHYAVSDYFPHVRSLRRVTISGDRPYSAALRDSRQVNL